jgi:Tol biopolymer transport system component
MGTLAIERILEWPVRAGRRLWHAAVMALAVGVAVGLGGCGGGGGDTGGGGGTPPPPAFGTAAAVRVLGTGRGVAVSADSRYVAFTRELNGLGQVILRDMQTGVEEIVSVSNEGTPGDQFSVDPVISRDGRYVAFNSSAHNLVGGVAYATDINGNRLPQVFLRDRVQGQTYLVSIGADGVTSANDSAGLSPRGAFSANGRKLVFVTQATNLTTGIEYPTLNGRPTNVFVRDLASSTTSLVSVSTDGRTSSRNDGFIIGGARADSSYPTISDDGRWVAFTSAASNLVTGVSYPAVDAEQVYLRDLELGSTRLLSAQPGGTVAADGFCVVYASGRQTFMSGDGRRVVYACRAAPLAAGVTGPVDREARVYDIYLWDAATDSNTLVSRSALAATGGNCQSLEAVLSRDGRFVAFSSCATDLVTDTDFWSYGPGSPAFVNAYRWDVSNGQMVLISRSRHSATAEAADADVSVLDLSDDGQHAAFISSAHNLVVSPLVPDTPTDVQSNLYVWRATGDELKLVSLSQDTVAAGWVSTHQLAGDGRGLAYVRIIGITGTTGEVSHVALN